MTFRSIKTQHSTAASNDAWASCRGYTAQTCADILTTALRTDDVIARIGSDEFAVLLPHTDTGVAKALLHRVQQAIQENNKACPDEPINLSIGVSTTNEPRSLSAVFKEADERIYAEKQRRKNAP